MDTTTYPPREGSVARPTPIDRRQYAYLNLEVPAAMADAITRHHVALNGLATRLYDAGIEDAVAAHSIAALIDSYRTELVTAIATYREQNDGR